MAAQAIHIDRLSPGHAFVHYGAGLLSVTVGLVVWDRRPDSRIGILMTAASFALALNELNILFTESALAVTVGLATIEIGAPILAQMVLSYPTGRLSSGLDRGFIILAYAVAVGYSVPFLLFYDPRAPHDPDVWEWPFRAVPVTHVGWYDVLALQRKLDAVVLAMTVVFMALVVRKIVRSTPGGRRVVLPLLATIFIVAARSVVQLALSITGSWTNFWTSPTMFWSETVADFAITLSLAAGLLWAGRARSAAADLVVELEHSPPGSVRDALARTLGDPSLELALWLPEQERYVDGERRPVELPVGETGRAVTVLGPTDAPVAALVHDPVLLERRALLTAACAAARFALENERLQAQLQFQLDEVRASRARIVQAGDDERRRLERDLHDGAQQRLLGLGMALQLARSHLGPSPNGADELLAEADAELRAALDELRELARGIHPAILTEQGLPAAVRSLAERSSVPVTILDLPENRLGEPVEAAAYFLVSESLANVAKYARASRVRVRVARQNGHAVVDVEDDGVGGADPRQGSGLRGLADRVQALDGTLTVESPVGAGTRIHAEIPCES
jgi:signal transduction histidine kinase